MTSEWQRRSSVSFFVSRSFLFCFFNRRVFIFTGGGGVASLRRKGPRTFASLLFVFFCFLGGCATTTTSLTRKRPNQRGPSNFTGFYWVLLGFTGFYLVLLGFTGFYWVLLGFTGFYWIWLGFTRFYWVLLGLSGFDWVWLGVTGFYWVWLGFSWWPTCESRRGSGRTAPSRVKDPVTSRPSFLRLRPTVRRFSFVFFLLFRLPRVWHGPCAESNPTLHWPMYRVFYTRLYRMFTYLR